MSQETQDKISQKKKHIAEREWAGQEDISTYMRIEIALLHVRKIIKEKK